MPKTAQKWEFYATAKEMLKQPNTSLCNALFAHIIIIHLNI